MNEEKYINEETPAIYFKSLILENVRCFKGKHEIDLSDGNGKPAQWTVLLGNNNTGKTTILRCLADLEAMELREKNFYPRNYYRQDYNPFHWNDFYWSDKNNRFDVNSKLFYNEDFLTSKYKICKTDWSFGEDWSLEWSSKNNNESDYFYLKNLLVFNYGTNRKMSEFGILHKNENSRTNEGLFDDNLKLLNVEEWILQLYLASLNRKKEAKLQLTKIKNALTKGILPDIKNFRVTTDNTYNSFVEFETDYSWIRLNELGYGYQSSIIWLCDLVKKMFDRYPDVDNPLAMPAIVLVDEIDLHLHPQWQRKIIGFLSEIFPNTQFIVTAHSPLIVQSADNINVVILRKEGDHVTIEQPKIKTFKGWSVEEILSELMDMGEKTYSETYLNLMKDFGDALDEENYEKAKEAYDELVKIVNPRSSLPKILRIQMSSLMPATQA